MASSDRESDDYTREGEDAWEIIVFYGKKKPIHQSRWQNLVEEQDYDPAESFDDSTADEDYCPRNSDTSEDSSDGEALVSGESRKRKRKSRSVGEDLSVGGCVSSVGVSGTGVSVDSDSSEGPSGVSSRSGVSDEVGEGARHRPSSVGGTHGAVVDASVKVPGVWRVSDWQVTKAKKARNLGQEYVSYKTKKVMPARQVGPPCKDGCFTALGRENIDVIFNNFWALGDVDLANNYLTSCMSVERYKKKYTKSEKSRQDVHVVFHVTHGNKEYKVCRPAFMSIHGIGKKKLEWVVAKKKLALESGTGTIQKDMRGKGGSARKIKGPELAFVHEYIRSLPAVSSHYTRAKAKNRLYLPAGGSITQLYVDFSRHMEDKHSGVVIVKETFFRQVFTKEYNISFSPPATDTCNTCEGLPIEISALKSSGKDARHLEEELQRHKDMAKRGQEFLKTSAGEGVRVIAIDLQQTLPVPKLPVNVAYYKRKLWLYNFCIYDLTKDTPYMFLWDETVASHGPNEIGSCLIKWLDMVAAEEDGNFTHLRIFADNCAGQNKNIYIILALLQQLHLKRLFRIEVIFLVSGHTYLPCDRAFGVIEKHLRTVQHICSVPRYVQLISDASKQKKYKTVSMEAGDFKDIKVLERSITNRSAGLKRARVLIIDVSNKSGFFMNEDYSLEESEAIFVPLTKGKQSAAAKAKGHWLPKQLVLQGIELPLKYPFGRVLNPAKLSDLEFLIPYVPGIDNSDWLKGLVVRQKTMRILLQDQQDDDEQDDNLAEDADNSDDHIWVDAQVLPVA